MIYADPTSEAHDGGPDHPERPERLRACMDALAAKGITPATDLPEATDDQLTRVHSVAYLERLERFCHQGGGRLDPDTYAGEESFDIARRASGACCRAVDEAFRTGARSFCLVRPPGHHATGSRAMGFCLINHVAVGAAHACTLAPAGRVAVVDFDVHHGNGTQDIFWRDPGMLYVSLHQFPWYPGSGRLEEVGEGPGKGATVNIPLPAGATDAVYLSAMQRVVVPALAAFEPDLLLVSAGFDAHAADPLAGMELTSEGFGAITSILVAAAEGLCAGRIVMTLEGGYDLDALAASLLATLGAMEHPDPAAREPATPDGTPASRQALERAVAFHRSPHRTPGG